MWAKQDAEHTLGTRDQAEALDIVRYKEDILCLRDKVFHDSINEDSMWL